MNGLAIAAPQLFVCLHTKSWNLRPRLYATAALQLKNNGLLATPASLPRHFLPFPPRYGRMVCEPPFPQT